ncbi:MAG: hypothetical protein EOO80_05060 [Oxalobacteraceae bacterium]|nr:MAG: hypothetical protein EOO80_05060 [Oxalobacteraceae bacterium]
MTQVRQKGLGLVELMVGITVGMIVAAGASMVAVNQINEHRRLMLETQIQQDLRAAADLIEQDLRRAGYRGAAEQSVWAPPAAVGTQSELAAATATANNFVEMVRTDATSVRSFTYLSSRAIPPTGEPVPGDHFGIRWNRDPLKNTLEIQIGQLANGGGNWQPITDPESIKIIDFDINVESKPAEMPDFCEKACTAGTNCPKYEVRRVSYTITAEARHDPSVRRTLTNTGRMRAEAITGACPA